MSLWVVWPKNVGFTDKIPARMLKDDGEWHGVYHAFTGPGTGQKRWARCDVKKAGTEVKFDYRPYKDNEKKFELGVLCLTFNDRTRSGKPKTIAWRVEGETDFTKFTSSLHPEEPISEEEVGLDSEPFDHSNLEDARRYILRSLAIRQGQQKFRNALKAVYKNKCALTGYPVTEVLEAAHIIGFKGPHTNHVQNGLLLRADIHTLFDMGLIGIDPDTWKVVLHPSLRKGPYGELHGSSFRLPENRGNFPDAKALKQHLSSSGL